MKSLSSRFAVAAGAVVLAVAASTPVVSTAGDAPHGRTVLANNLFTPLSLAVTRQRVVFFSESFLGQLWVKRPGQEPRLIHQARQGRGLGAISTRRGTVFFAEGAGAPGEPTRSFLFQRTPDGEITRIANLGRYERNVNPDADVVYGIQDELSPKCEEQWPVRRWGPPTQNGDVNSNPYASAVAGGTVYVADAGGNTILAVDLRAEEPAHRISTVAVIPGVPVEITEQFAEANRWPECVVGETYVFQPVPTDVEIGSDGLYVTRLPGGPEDGSVPGSVLLVDPETGESGDPVASGFAGATGLAVARDGTLYVAELFGGEVTVIEPGQPPATFVRTALPGAVEVRGLKLYTTENVLSGLEPGTRPRGKVVRYDR